MSRAEQTSASGQPLTAEQRRFLADLFGEDAVFDAVALRVYASDASLCRGEALAMVCPRQVDQVRTFMAWAQAEGVFVHPRGRGTSLSGGAYPTRPGVVLSLLGLNRILDISDTDFTADVEPGVCTAEFQARCEAMGLFFPPDPASGKATTLGGNVATCAGGLRAVRYGVTRDYVLGVDLVVPGGELLHFGRRTHKDVVGLDLARLAVGSEGTLGIITRLLLKLIPKPEASASLLAGFTSLDAALEAMGRLFAAGLLPSALEFMNETVLDLLRRNAEATGGHVPWPNEVRSLLLVQVDGLAETVPLELARLATQLDAAVWTLRGLDKTGEDRLWAYRRQVSSASYLLGPDRIGGDMAVPRGSLLTAVRRLEAIAARHGKTLIGFGHAGDGNIHANLHYDAADPDDTRRTLQAHREMDEAVLALGGSLSGEHGGGSLKDVGAQLGNAEHALMREIRSVFDPAGILNPGKGY